MLGEQIGVGCSHRPPPLTELQRAETLWSRPEGVVARYTRPVSYSIDRDRDVIVREKASDKFAIRALPLGKLRSSLRGIPLLPVAGVAGIGGGSWKNLQNPQRDYTKTNPPTE